MIYIIFALLVGTSVGSFINVMIDRTTKDEDWVRGRSKCDHCRKTLKWYDMIPVLSYIFYLGKSRCCKKVLSYRYPLVEILVGLLFVWWLAVGFWFFRLVVAPLTIIQPGFWLLTGLFLMILALSDLFYGVVIMPVVWLASITIVLYRLVLWHYGAFQLVDLASSLFTGMGFFGFFWAIYKLTKGRGMADGDMYVAIYVGLLLGWPRGMVAIMLSFIIGAMVGVALIATKIRSRKDTLPFVPFMVIGTVLSLIGGIQIWNWLY